MDSIDKSIDPVSEYESMVLPVGLHNDKRLLIEVVGTGRGIQVTVDGEPVEGLVSFAVSFDLGQPVIKIVRLGKPFNPSTREYAEVAFTKIGKVNLQAEVIA